MNKSKLTKYELAQPKPIPISFQDPAEEVLINEF